MAFPSVAAKGTTLLQSSDTTSHVVSNPSGITVGDLLLLFLAQDGNPTTMLTGWTALVDVANGANRKLTIFHRTADGSEGTSTTVTTSAAEQSVGSCWRVTGWHGTTAPEAASATHASTTAPDPPSLNPANWDAEDTLWIVVLGEDGAGVTVTYPTNYSGNQQTDQSGLAGASAALSAATRNLNAASDDPGTFTITTSAGVVATIAVRPAAATAPVSAPPSSPVRARQHLLIR